MVPTRSDLPMQIEKLSQHLTFKGPVRIGESLAAVCEIDDGLDGDRYRLTTRIENDEGTRVLDGTATVLVDPLPQ